MRDDSMEMGLPFVGATEARAGAMRREMGDARYEEWLRRLRRREAAVHAALEAGGLLVAGKSFRDRPALSAAENVRIRAIDSSFPDADDPRWSDPVTA